MVALAIATASLAVAGYGAYSSSEANRKASKASRKAEGVRKTQLQLDSARQRRLVQRQSAVQRANALANSTASGAFGSSRESGVQTSLLSQEGEQLSTIGQAEELGFSIFSLNQQIATARGDAATASAVQNLGLTVAQNSQTIANIGSSAYNYFNPVPAANDASSQISNGLV